MQTLGEYMIQFQGIAQMINQMTLAIESLNTPHIALV